MGTNCRSGTWRTSSNAVFGVGVAKRTLDLVSLRMRSVLRAPHNFSGFFRRVSREGERGVKCLEKSAVRRWLAPRRGRVQHYDCALQTEASIRSWMEGPSKLSLSSSLDKKSSMSHAPYLAGTATTTDRQTCGATAVKEYRGELRRRGGKDGRKRRQVTLMPPPPPPQRSRNK